MTAVPKTGKLFDLASPFMEDQIADNETLAQRGPVNKKIKVPRWLTKKVGEYDIENDFWVAAECHINDNFLAFSKVVYLPN